MYARAEDTENAVALLAELGEDARVLAGGQSLVPMMALRLARPEALVDITRCVDLKGVTGSTTQLTVGAAVTAREVERHPDAGGRHPLLVRALGHVGHPEIRARGTVCGALAHADPAAEVPAVLLATEGTVTLAGPAGPRRIASQDFFVGPYMTALDEGEMVVEAEFPLLLPTTGWAIEELARRHGDFAVVGTICLLDAGADATCAHASITLFGVAGTPVRARQAERAMIGTFLDDADLDAAASAAVDEVDVLGDLHGSVTYRRSVSRALLRRALRTAREGTSARRDEGRAEGEVAG